jgi:predicted DNA-binding protein YlxM (UPF0122 family)
VAVFVFAKDMKLAYLLDFYIDLFDDHTAAVMRAYYEDDLSLAEIAAGEGISRQGVRHIIKKCEEHILFLEERLGLARQQSLKEEAIEDLRRVGDTLSDEAKGEIDKVVKKLEGV